ncbi:hypothetical protein [Brevundimonas sp.]|uniref:hypothetical protein n=1 Tax=Brevundimonas sp. TaxID=1871086 RepID=UPI002ABAE0E6|nr:hypothetical protein [Brevundimonas sp.]MDZ4364151.1 hypothetical protein [Brevundimonas sp.]
MRLSVAVPVVVLVIASTLLGLGLTALGQASATRRQAEAIPRTGMEILNAHACGRGETKQILILGTEDGFSPAGSESGFIRPGRTYAFYLSREGAGQYDQVNVDRTLADSFKIEGPVAGGLFLIRIRGLNATDSQNDSMTLGALSRAPEAVGGAWVSGGSLADFGSTGGWSVEGESILAPLDDIEMQMRGDVRVAADGSALPAVRSLTDFLNEGGDAGWLDVSIGDDTAVDFMGLALCRPPAVRRGVTLASMGLPGSEPSRLIHLSCHHSRDGEPRCDPYVGDTVCSATKPVACLKPGDIPAPVDRSGRILTSAWSGGDIAVTDPVSGDRFRTVGQVNAFCARLFGDGWRVLTLHDGNRLQSVSGRGDRATVTDRVWADIADQPHGTCWARE